MFPTEADSRRESIDSSSSTAPITSRQTTRDDGFEVWEVNDLIPAEKNGVVMTSKSISPTPNARYIASMINDNIVIVETSSNERKPRSKNEKIKLSSHNGITSNGSGRAGATIRSLSDDELPDPETVRKFKDVFEALALRQQGENPDINKHNIGRSKSMIIVRGRAWCNGNSGNIYHRHGACDSAIHTIRSVEPHHKTTRASFQRSCSELDQYFQKHDMENPEDLWDRYSTTDRGSPVSPEVIAKIRQHGTSVQFFGAEAQVVSEMNNWELSYDSHEDYFGVDERDGFLLDYPLNHCPHKPKIIGAIPKSGSSGNSSCASSTFDDYDNNNCSSDPSSPYSWLNLSGTLDRLRAVFAGEENDTNFRQTNGAPDGSPYMKVIKSRIDEENDQHPLRFHGIWRKNPCWPGSYYVIYDFTRPSPPNIVNDDAEFSDN